MFQRLCLFIYQMITNPICWKYKHKVAVGYILSIILGNMAVVYFGLINLFGLTFPAGALFIGLTFSMRDLVQREWNHMVWVFIIISTFITAILGLLLPNTLPVSAEIVALASASAFIISEGIDWLVYTILKKNIIWRISISNIFSTPIDSMIFVGIIFGNYNLLSPPVYGQTIIKYLSGLLIIPIIIIRKRKLNLQEK
jgi:queuosine precursor transporter